MQVMQMLDELFRRRYVREVKKRLRKNYPGEEVTLIIQISGEAATLFANNQAFALDAPATSNLKLTSLALATYRILQARGMSQSQALEWVREALIEPSRKKIIFFTRLTLRLKRDPLPLVSAISKGKQAKAYGAAFEMEHETDDLRSYFTTRVKKCLYHDFFCANGSPEMTRVFCAFDDTWGNVLETGVYGVKFERPTTLGAGDDMCRFQFKRTSR